MSKYIKSISLLLFITASLTGFGLYKAQASSPHPELKIVTSEGKPEHIEPIQTLGFVSDSQMPTQSSTVKLENGDFSYFEDLPFLQRLDFSFDPKINDLINDHRSFMRGKSRLPEHYTETEQHIIYTGMESDLHWNHHSSNQMIIAVLDKGSEKEETYSVSLGASGPFYSIRATSIDYPLLSVVVEDFSSSDAAETLVYTFDIENPAEGVTNVVNLTEETERNARIRLGLHYDNTERFITFQTVRQTAVSNYDYTEEISGYYAYDTQAHEVIDIQSFEDIETLLFTDNDTLYVGKALNEAIELYQIDLTGEEMSLISTIEMASPSILHETENYNGLFNQNLSILDGKFYAYGYEYTEDIGRPLFQVTDIETQETLFQGTIEPKDTSKRESTTINLFELQIDPENN
ncbi:hypothetical protein SAMN04488102_10885 [Alkalibacterium subtropicum]|uniref:Arylsulfotransferase (ASST) n=1 Tax=Alkalibacterium subtropicum TaxID=753702 RepID=A0A1I1JR84_9LACT|nr:hypothetical protein [Alkalibacterium subtropicum]SFC50462.1 hypothetical protein SAMN04488102_10885 [Alkalibacterium subtropicum]